jgi:hypothetical protein
MQSDTPATAGKQATAGMLTRARIPAAGQGTTSTAKLPATAGSVWKSFKKGQEMKPEIWLCMGAGIKNLVTLKCPQVALVFARSGSEGLQGPGNTDKNIIV